MLLCFSPPLTSSFETEGEGGVGQDREREEGGRERARERERERERDFVKKNVHNGGTDVVKKFYSTSGRTPGDCRYCRRERSERVIVLLFNLLLICRNRRERSE